MNCRRAEKTSCTTDLRDRSMATKPPKPKHPELGQIIGWRGQQRAVVCVAERADLLQQIAIMRIAQRAKTLGHGSELAQQRVAAAQVRRNLARRPAVQIVGVGMRVV